MGKGTFFLCSRSSIRGRSSRQAPAVRSASAQTRSSTASRSGTTPVTATAAVSFLPPPAPAVAGGQPLRCRAMAIADRGRGSWRVSISCVADRQLDREGLTTYRVRRRSILVLRRLSNGVLQLALARSGRGAAEPLAAGGGQQRDV